MTLERKRPHTPHYDDSVLVGSRIREARTAAGLSQRALAFPGCSAAYISRIEIGERVPSKQVMEVITDRINSSLEDQGHAQLITVSHLAYGREDVDPRVAAAMRAVIAADGNESAVKAYQDLAAAARRAARERN